MRRAPIAVTTGTHAAANACAREHARAPARAPRVVVAAVAAMLAATNATADAAPAPRANLPAHGELVAGKSLGGLRIGMTPAQVRRAWGTTYGVCRSCRDRTWYFTYRPYQPQGAAVSFRGSRVDAIWTLWSPPGWQTRNGSLRLGARESEATAMLGSLFTAPCGSYTALLRTRGALTTVYYMFAGKLWGFGLMSASASACR